MKSSRYKAFRRLGWGLLVMLLIMGIAEITIFRDAYTYDLGTEKGARGGIIGQWAQIDRSFEAADSDRIEYAIFGDSQSLDAFRPDMMADELGLDADQVFNFSVTGGKPTDIAYTYRQYIDRLPSLRHIILVVNEHQFNNADSAKDSKFKFHATLGQRIKAMDGDNYGELLVGWAFRSFGMRSEWQGLVGRYRSGELPLNPAPFPGGIQPTTWSAPADRTADFAKNVADRWFKNWSMDGVYTHAFDQLVSDISDDGIGLTIVQLPRTALFEEAVRSTYAAEQQAYVDHIRSIAEASGVEFTVMDPIITGVSIESFRDSNHVNAHGAEQLSRYAADRWWR